MSNVFSHLPTTVDIRGTEYPIHTDFRVSLQFEELVTSDLEEAELCAKVLKLFYPDEIPIDLWEEAIEKILEFYSGGRVSRQGEIEEPVYSYESDQEYIYSAFLEQYKIDLYDVNYLHWWKYKAMFSSLDDKCRFMEIVGYRSVKIDNKMSREQKSFYKKMKKKYKLQKSMKKTEEEDALVEALLNGGNIDDVL